MAPPPGTIPPELPPTVEEAYRRKCIQLKQRLNQVDEANDATRLRLVRQRRGIEKLRLERTFLLEQLSKRTSTNVEDSEGSPSPPPTPKEKPLRVKRGHRKPEFLNNLGDGRLGSAFIQQRPNTHSPVSDAFSHSHTDTHPSLQPATSLSGNPPQMSITNGHPPHVPNNSQARPPYPSSRAFEIYATEKRPIILETFAVEFQNGSADINVALQSGWEKLAPLEKARYAEEAGETHENGNVVRQPAPAPAPASEPAVAPVPAPVASKPDEDVEMGNNTEEETPGADASAGGFTAVNRS